MTNLVPNGGFDVFIPPNNFPPWAGAGYYTAAPIVHSGANAAQIGNPTSYVAYSSLVQNFSVPTSTQQTYYFSFWLAVLAGHANVPFRALLIAYPSSTIYTGSAIQIPYVGQPLDQYVHYTYTWTDVPLGTTSFGIEFYVNVPTFSDASAFAVDNVYLSTTAVCYSGNSMVLARDVVTQDITQIPAKDIYVNQHEVYDTHTDDFVPVMANIVSGPVTKYRLVPKDAIAPNKPDSDLLITGGHYILVDGVEIKARDLPQAKCVTVDPEPVYSICTEKRCAILINNIPVIAWDYGKWISNIKQLGIAWTDNKPSIDNKYDRDRLEYAVDPQREWDYWNSVDINDLWYSSYTRNPVPQ